MVQITSGSPQVRRRPPLPPANVLRPLPVVTDFSVAPYRPLASTSRSRSAPVMSRSSTPVRNGDTGYERTSHWTTSSSTARYQPRSASVAFQSTVSTSSPALSRRGGSTYRPHSVPRSLAGDFDDDYEISTRRSSATRYPQGAGQSAALRIRSRSYLDDLQYEDDMKRSSLSDLRWKTAQAKQNLDQHKRLLDRVLLARGSSDGPTVSVYTKSNVDSGVYSQPVSRTYYENSRPPLPQTYASVTSKTADVSPARRRLRQVITQSRGNRNLYD